MIRPTPHRLLWLAAFAAAALPCTSAMRAHAGDDLRVTVDEPWAEVAAAGVAVRVDGEGEKEALRVAALVNDALRRAGLRPDATAPARLYVTFARPRTVAGPDRPEFAILGRGGSSSKAEFGLEIQVPIEQDTAPPLPVRHRLIARLERAPGDVVWHGEASVDAVLVRGEQEALRRLAEQIARALASAASPRAREGEARPSRPR